jgi:hypothetical protein
MKFIKSKKGIALLAAVVAVGVAAFGAYAYFTTTGSGTGTASVGTSSTIALTGTTTGTLYPGTSETVNLSANNPSSGHQKLGVIHLDAIHACSVAWSGHVCNGGSPDVGDKDSGCGTVDLDSGTHVNALTDDFFMADVSENQDLPSGNSTPLTNATGTLYMNDLSHSQDGCKSAFLLLELSAAAPAS